MECLYCGSVNYRKNGTARGLQRYRCKDCHHYFSEKPRKFSFKYSPRAGTPAAEHDNQVSETVKAERLAILQDLLSSQQKTFNQSLIGKTLPILIEKQGRNAGQLIGRSPYLQSVYCDATPNIKMDDIVNIKITGNSLNSLNGTAV